MAEQEQNYSNVSTICILDNIETKELCWCNASDIWMPTSGEPDAPLSEGNLGKTALAQVPPFG